MKPIYRTIVAPIAAAVAFIAMAASPGQAQSSISYITCESEGGSRPTTCRIPDGAEARFDRQLSTARCVEGTSWEIKRDIIWVWDGCRARFAIARAGAGSEEFSTNDATGAQLAACRSEVRERTGSSAVTLRASSRDPQTGRTRIRWEAGQDRTGSCVVDLSNRVVDFNWDSERSGGLPGTDIRPGAGDEVVAVVRCESSDGRQRQCRFAGTGQVRLARQLSTAACREGATWGAGTNYVWVNGGCRAEFEIVRAGSRGANPTRVTCESFGVRQQQCTIPSGARVELIRQISETSCREGTNWGVGTTFIWVNRGCRAEFRVTPRSGIGTGAGVGGSRVSCESVNGRRRECSIPANARVELSRQLSATSCREGTNWDVERDYVWVDRGCGAEFRIVSTGTIGSGMTRVTCESVDGRQATCRIPEQARVELERQLSDTPCRRGSTWGTGSNFIWVNGGCRAEFTVERLAGPRP